MRTSQSGTRHLETYTISGNQINATFSGILELFARFVKAASNGQTKVAAKSMDNHGATHIGDANFEVAEISI